ncbi:hypothetical protein [Corallococcus exiguus]|uniref:hypothetical protein n=1 Tax=Corallococcus exiguus TaxID=83462 RepID=UPI003DA67076
MTTFKCPSCNKGEVREVAQPGRRTHFRNIPDLEIPAHVAIPTCSNPECGEEWINHATAKRIDAAMAEVYQSVVASKVEDAIGKLKPVIPQRDLERLLGLSGGYISKVKSGKETSAPLVSTLMMLAVSPWQRVEELRGLWRTKPREEARPTLAVCAGYKWADDSVKVALLGMEAVGTAPLGMTTIVYSARVAERRPTLSQRSFMGLQVEANFDAEMSHVPESMLAS